MNVENSGSSVEATGVPSAEKIIGKNPSWRSENAIKAAKIRRDSQAYRWELEGKLEAAQKKVEELQKLYDDKKRECDDYLSGKYENRLDRAKKEFEKILKEAYPKKKVKVQLDEDEELDEDGKPKQVVFEEKKKKHVTIVTKPVPPPAQQEESDSDDDSVVSLSKQQQGIAMNKNIQGSPLRSIPKPPPAILKQMYNQNYFV